LYEDIFRRIPAHLDPETEAANNRFRREKGHKANRPKHCRKQDRATRLADSHDVQEDNLDDAPNNVASRIEQRASLIPMMFRKTILMTVQLDSKLSTTKHSLSKTNGRKSSTFVFQAKCQVLGVTPSTTTSTLLLSPNRRRGMCKRNFLGKGEFKRNQN
jgi:hypothetical protein